MDYEINYISISPNPLGILRKKPIPNLPKSINMQ